MSSCDRCANEKICKHEKPRENCQFVYPEFTIKEEPFTWNDNMSEIALEDFSMIQRDLPYGISQSIGMALAKLKLLEEQGCEVTDNEENKII